MSFENLHQKNNLMSFDINNVDVSVVNAVRRVIISEVPTVAFAFDPNGKENDLKVVRNTGSLHNEFLCHRISLLPLHFSQVDIENFDSSNFNFVLKAKNETSDMMEVTTQHFEIFDSSGSKYSDDFHKSIFPPDNFTGDFPIITKLKPNLFDKNKGDEIHVLGTASLDIGKSHCRWSPTSLCCYYNNLDDKAVETGFEAYQKQHSSSKLSPQELRARFDTMEKYRYFAVNDYNEPCSFRFSLESECGLSPAYIVEKSFHVLIGKLKQFIINLEDKNKIKMDSNQGMTYFTVDNEDHTLGNFVQAMLYNICIRYDESDDKVLSYIGYHKPHPLENNIVIKIKTESNDPVKVVQVGCKRIIHYLEQLITEWTTFTSSVK